MAYTTINKSTDYFNTITYTGDGSSSRSITGVGFQPDFTWFKSRSGTNWHQLFDAVRGAGKVIYSNDAAAEGDDINRLSAFISDGFTVGADSNVNGNTNSLVAWNWKAGGGQGSSNTDGSINTTYTSVNTTAGFSISKWNGDGSSSATVGHGLGVIPKVIISKAISASAPEGGWFVMHSSLADGENIRLNHSHGQYSTSQFSQGLIKESATTNQVFGFQAGSGVDNINASGHTYITYCFAEKTGYSKFGSYVGNGASGAPNADGTFIYTGFKPAFIMVKCTSHTSAWTIWDNKRAGYNPETYRIEAHNNNAEYTGNAVWADLLSNGFKLKQGDTDTNGAGRNYVYMAFGQSLVGSNNVPCTAR